MEITVTNLNEPKRLLGFDFWRFFGSFFVFVIHNEMILAIAGAQNPELLNAPNYLMEFLYPTAITIFGYCAVPVFLFISGYFTLGRPLKDTDWSKCVKNFTKYVLYYWKWLLFALVVYLLVPNFFFGGSPLAGMTTGQAVFTVLKNFINMNLMDGGIITPVSLNWFIMTLAWVSLLTVIFKPFIQTQNIKTIRKLMVVMFFTSCGLAFFRNFGYHLTVVDPESLFGQLLANFNPLYTGALGYVGIDSLTWMYLAGGWFAMDTEVKQKIKDMKWSKVVVIAVVLTLLQAAVTFISSKINLQVYYQTLDYYCNGGWIFGSSMFVLIAYKLNFVIKEDSKIGKFTMKYSPDLLGVMIMGWTFGPYMLGNIFVPVLYMMIESLWNPSMPIVFTLVYLVFCVVYWAIILVVVHLLKKVPLVKNMFTA